MPYATAEIKGNYLAPKLNGIASFFPWLDGTLVKVEIANLPTGETSSNIFAIHIHEGDSCGGPNTKFESAKGHYNPTNEPHPLHAGDMPSLFSNKGYALMVFYTERFKPEDIVGKTIIVHAHSDDYMSQPAGNAGDRIGCGVIEKK